ncbi:MAG TPA: glycerate kinase [Hanamia sp.]
MNILIAPNAFKHGVNAGDAALAIREGLTQSKLEGAFEYFPVGDGGDGTGSLIVSKSNGIHVNAVAHDPLKRKIHASFGLIDAGKTAVIEMATASGLHQLQRNELNPMQATSMGTGELITDAMDKGARKIIIGMGGSATVDGGMGILKALGFRFLSAGGKDISLPGDLMDLFSIDSSGIDRRIRKCEVIVLCDVDNKLLGKQGAAAVFGPQKGASDSEVPILDAGLSRLSEVILSQTGKNIAALKYGGTAGGAAAGLCGLLNAKLVNGINYFLELTGFDLALQKCDLVITGEGSIDDQTTKGKGPFGVARRAKLNGLPVIGIAGKVPLNPDPVLQLYFDALIPIGHEPLDMATALAFTENNLIRTSREIGNLLALSNIIGIKGFY